MSTREEARVALVTKVEALKATWTAYTLVVQYDNRLLVDLAKQTNPYLRVSMEYLDGNQIALGPNGGHRLIGAIVVEAWVKEGAGMKQANDLLQHFYPSMHMTDSMFPLRTYAAQFRSGNAVKGWVAEAAIIGFWHDAT